MQIGKISRRALAIVAVKWLLAIALAYVALWSLNAAVDWTAWPELWRNIQILFLIALIVGLIEHEMWEWLSQRTLILANLLRLLVVPLLCTLMAVFIPFDMPAYILSLLVFFTLNILLAFLGLMLRDRSWSNLTNLALTLVSVIVMLLIIEFVFAPIGVNALQNAQREAARTQAIDSANAPLSSVEGTSTTPTPPSTAITEFVGQPGPGPAWGPLTGWGTNTDTTIHSYMDGVYDVNIEYNSLGFRGPEIPYEKPDDVYRILLVGDSYIEALQVEYADTIYAQLGEMLKDIPTPDGKRIEVFGVGATGWGTLQAYLYYHHEGVKFQPDLVIHFFVINDVADNNPAHFYDYRGIDFSIQGDTVEVVQGEAAPAESESAGQRWLSALPPALQNTATIGLLRQLISPPRIVVGLGGALAGVHPQNYIYVSYPEIEGYPEGWERTRRAYEIWANETTANDAPLWVVPVDISAEKITELSTYFRDSTADWIWDIDLPTKRLHTILDPLDVPLIETRQYYADYAESIGQRPFDALFYTQDWHWNPEGHRITAQLLAEKIEAGFK